MRSVSAGPGKEPRQTKRKWPDDAFLACGDVDTDVFFFEAYLPDTLLRVEANTPEKAERECWQMYQAILKCESHFFESFHYVNGAKMCRFCGFFKSAITEEMV